MSAAIWDLLLTAGIVLAAVTVLARWVRDWLRKGTPRDDGPPPPRVIVGETLGKALQRRRRDTTTPRSDPADGVPPTTHT